MMPWVVALSAAHMDVGLESLGLLAYRTDEIESSLRRLAQTPGVSEAAIVPTCNRTEIYALLDGDQPSVLEDFLIADRQLANGLPGGVRRLEGATAVAAHLFRVSAGLESMVVGEGEIQGQIRQAHRAALDAGTAGSELDALFRAAIQTGRRVRHETFFGTARRSLGRTAVQQLAGDDPTRVTGMTVLVIGAGKIASVVIEDLRDRGASVMVCSRTEERARRLAGAGCSVLPLARALDALGFVDAAICCTSAPHLLVTSSDVRHAMRRRRGRELVLIDLSVPRDVDPAVRGWRGVRLLDLEDLGQAGFQDAAKLGEALAVVERIVDQEVRRYVAWTEGRRAGAVVARLRERAEQLCQAELDKAWRRRGEIAKLDAARAVHTSLARLFHGLSNQAREAAAAGDDDFLARLSLLLK